MPAERANHTLRVLTDDGHWPSNRSILLPQHWLLKYSLNLFLIFREPPRAKVRPIDLIGNRENRVTRECRCRGSTMRQWRGRTRQRSRYHLCRPFRYSLDRRG